MKNIDKVLKDQPDFFIEFQPPPGTKVSGLMGMGGTVLTEPTISLTSHLVLGFKGNVTTAGTTYITFFETPLTPEGAMDLADFQFGFATQSMTFNQVSNLAMSLKTPQVKGGSFIKGIEKYENPLKTFAKALDVYEIRNPNHIGTYVYGDPNHPFPRKEAFNLIVMGPFASETDSTGATISGPYLHAVGDMTVLKQKMGGAVLTLSDNGLHGLMTTGVNFKIGPLGRTGFSLKASADIDAKKQALFMHGNVFGRALDASLTPYKLSIDSPATCATPFSLNETLDIAPILSISDLMDALPGVNVDPGKFSDCIGKDLEAAYKWVSTTGSSLAGYSAKEANAALNKMADAEKQAEKAAKDAYNATKNAARDAANKATNQASNAFRDAGNAFKKLGGKKEAQERTGSQVRRIGIRLGLLLRQRTRCRGREGRSVAALERSRLQRRSLGQRPLQREVLPRSLSRPAGLLQDRFALWPSALAWITGSMRVARAARTSAPSTTWAAIPICKKRSARTTTRMRSITGSITERMRDATVGRRGARDRLPRGPF